jgi:glycosyltransferase involved in cell wall biosynthesis
VKLLICIDWFAPAYKAGGPISSVRNLVDALKNQTIQIGVLTSNTDLGGELLKGIETDKWVSFNQATKVYYASGEGKKINNLKHQIHRGEVLYINGIYSFFFNFLPLILSRGKRIIISPRGMLHPGALSIKSRKKVIYIKVLRLLLPNKAIFHATNEEEKRYILNTFGNKHKVYVIENLPRKLCGVSYPPKIAEQLNICSVAIISPMKNYLRVLEALMYCREQIQYDIYGPVKDEEYWKLCKDQILKLPANIKINYHGDIVPDRVSEALRPSHVFIQVSKSENFGHSIYEALTAGKPVITSHKTPWSGLEESKAGINVDPEDTVLLSRALSYFSNMPESELKHWSMGAGEYAEKALNTEILVSKYKKMFEAA